MQNIHQQNYVAHFTPDGLTLSLNYLVKHDCSHFDEGSRPVGKLFT